MKYTPGTIPIIEKFTDEMSLSNFWKHSSIHHIACLLGVCRKTVYNWEKEYPDLLHTIKKWEEKRNALFLELTNKNGAWIFLAKNWLEMTDKQEIQQTTEFKPLQVIIVNNGDKPNNAS